MKDFEFLPEHHIRARRNERLRLTRTWLLVVLTVSMVCWTLYSKARIAAAEDQVAFVKKAIEDSRAQVSIVTALHKQKSLYTAQRTMVDKLGGGHRRTELLEEIVRCLPNRIVLTRVEIDRHDRAVRTGQMPVSRATRRRGAKQKPATEAVDRIRIEGVSLDDMAMTRFVQDVSDGTLIDKGEVGYTKDSTLLGKEVRVFAATFFAPIVTPVDSKVANLAAKGVR
jgi:Tfp pilus assembly protein PilN